MSLAEDLQNAFAISQSEYQYAKVDFDEVTALTDQGKFVLVVGDMVQCPYTDAIMPGLNMRIELVASSRTEIDAHLAANEDYLYDSKIGIYPIAEGENDPFAPRTSRYFKPGVWDDDCPF